MANQEQVERLKQGVDVWNDWREKNPETKIDLTSANLCESDLARADLAGADLSDAVLKDAFLTDVRLTGATARGTNFCRANLHCAKLNGTEFRNALFKDAELNCAELKGADLCGANLSNADLKNANFNGADLCCAKLSDADLRGAHFNGATLREANLSGVKLAYASLANASLNWAELNGIELYSANIEGTNLDYAIVDGRTLMADCKINDSTYAHGVGLDSARIEESLKTKLKKNIRKKYWIEKYPFHLDLELVKQILILVFSRRLLLAIHKGIYRNITRKLVKEFLQNLFTLTLLKSCLVRLFWFTSDFGSSTTRLLQSFLITSVIYTIIYFVPVFIGPDQSFIQGIQFSEVINSTGQPVSYTFNYWGNLLRAFYFSVVTMTTLGFGDISANPTSTCGHFLVISQVLIGYVLLGALITRLSILFQDVG